MSESYNLPGSSYTTASAQPDCPRFTEQHAWIHYGIMQQDGEAVTTYSENSVAVCNQQPASDGSVPCNQTIAPDGTIYKEFYATSGWRKGLVTATEFWSGGVRKKWTATTWTHDGTESSVTAINPRVTETNIYDSDGNRRRTTIDYGIYAPYSLPYLVTEYASDGVQELRRSYTDYNLAQSYTDRRIIGLVSMTHVYDSAAGRWAAKMTYTYDEAGSVGAQATTATGHDQSYNSSFLARGNITSATRWDADDTVNASKAVTSHTTYDAAGSVLTSADPLGHQTSVAYADSFSDGNNSRNTFAYPTTVTDAEGYQSTAKYDYTTGAVTETRRPSSGTTALNNVTYETHSIVYDWLARPQKDTNLNNGFYTRWEYPNPDNGLALLSFQNIRSDLQENFSAEVYDGAGASAARRHLHARQHDRLLQRAYGLLRLFGERRAVDEPDRDGWQLERGGRRRSS